MNSLVNDNQNQVVIDPTKEYLPELVGEGKKFKTPEELAKGKWHADATIELMKREMEQMRVEYETERKQNLTRDQLENAIAQLNRQPASSERPIVNEVTTPAFDPTQIKSLVSDSIQEWDTKRKQDANFELVKNKAQEKFGSNYQEQISKQANELGLSGKDVDAMARTQPMVLISALGLDRKPEPQTFQAPPRSTHQAFQPTSGNKRTWAWYQELKRKDPALYRDTKTHQQMMQDYAELGTAFEDGNFHQYN